MIFNKWASVTLWVEFAQMYLQYVRKNANRMDIMSLAVLLKAQSNTTKHRQTNNKK